MNIGSSVFVRTLNKVSGVTMTFDQSFINESAINFFRQCISKVFGYLEGQVLTEENCRQTRILESHTKQDIMRIGPTIPLCLRCVQASCDANSSHG